MDSKNIRLFYKNQFDLGQAIKEYIDKYFANQVGQEEFEENIISIINSNKEKFFKDNDIAKKPKQILGKTRIQVLYQILDKRGAIDEKDSNIK